MDVPLEDFFYWDEEDYVDEDVEGDETLIIGLISEGMFLSAAKLEDLPC